MAILPNIVEDHSYMLLVGQEGNVGEGFWGLHSVLYLSAFTSQLNLLLNICLLVVTQSTHTLGPAPLFSPAPGVRRTQVIQQAPLFRLQ